jgi:hypothetical protein
MNDIDRSEDDTVAPHWHTPPDDLAERWHQTARRLVREGYPLQGGRRQRVGPLPRFPSNFGPKPAAADQKPPYPYY